MQVQQRSTQQIAYDAMGNRQSLALGLYSGNDQNVSYTHNKLNQMTGMSVTASGNTTTAAFAYDASGNMTQQAQNSGGSTYLYDDVDRLISLVQKNTSTGAYTRRSQFVYDGEDRKVISREYSWDTATSAWVQESETRRIYDGMDVVQERDAQNVTKVRYVRSGNIGGLLARSDANESVFYSYDGSGNVVGLTNASQQVVAEYAYDAWGNTLRATGAMAAANTYRYSTKELQASTGLYDYGYRFYSPGLGRWINRDPIEEAGGLNLYEAFLSDPVNNWDEYGEDVTVCAWPLVPMLGGLARAAVGPLLGAGARAAFKKKAVSTATRKARAAKRARVAENATRKAAEKAAEQGARREAAKKAGEPIPKIGKRTQSGREKNAIEDARDRGNGHPPVKETNLKPGEQPHYHPGNGKGGRHPKFGHDHFYYNP